MSRAVSISTGKSYTLRRVCRVWERARSTTYHQLGRPEQQPKQRPGPKGPYSDSELVDHIRAVITESFFHGEGYRKVWARLRIKGVRTSRRRVLRLMRESHLQAPQRSSSHPGPKNHDGTIIPDNVHEMWGTDMTHAYTLRDGWVSVFGAVDHFSAACVGVHGAKPGTRFEALEPVRQGIRENLGTFAADVALGITMRHDCGSQYMSEAFQDEIEFLGFKASPAFVRSPQCNGCIERFFRTLKENLLWIREFEDIEDLNRALQEFKDRYNRNWLIERHDHKTPNEVIEQDLTSMAEAA